MSIEVEFKSKEETAKDVGLLHVPPSVRRRMRQLNIAVESESFKADLPTRRVEDDLANLTPL